MYYMHVITIIKSLIILSKKKKSFNLIATWSTLPPKLKRRKKMLHDIPLHTKNDAMYSISNFVN